ncbi:acetylxylan esterase [Geosmithia morbida]|uniref:Acetylxylan esterase n=1 Tax=Geosmithia morbida TaxID=1094350 RepID=A0A9P5D3Z6_9HYPO|nr:acetylxylan esterase [Geosmithia morbida]KAF4122300.1 acetylxylan esterase [Geosmithia morbida]
MRPPSSKVLALSTAIIGAVAAEDCADNLHLLVARATNEDPGEGQSGQVATKVIDRLNGTDSVGLDYPATFIDPAYARSVLEGTTRLKEDILDYRTACPDTKMALLGYSQGAQVIMDTICGSSSVGFGNETAISSDIIDESIVAIVLFGDPSFVANTTYDAGTAIRDGIFPRDNTTTCEGLSDRLISFCDTGDVYCDAGNNRTTHGSYIQVYGDEAADYIIDRYEKATGDSSNSTDSSSAGDGDGDGNSTDSGNAGNSDGDSNNSDDGGSGAASGMAPTLGVIGLASLVAAIGLL